MSNDLVVLDSDFVNSDLYETNVKMDDFGQNDLTYGWLRIAQGSTEQQKKGSPSRIAGLEAGHFFNSLSSKVYGEKVQVVFLKFFHSFREQEPGEQGKFVRSLTSEEFESLKESGIILWDKSTGKQGWLNTQSGNVVKESWNYMVMLPQDPDAGVVRLALSAGSKKYANAWNTNIRLARKPDGTPASPFSVVWELELSLESSTTGSSYYAIGANGRAGVKKVGMVGAGLIAEAKFNYEFFQKQQSTKIAEAGERVVSGNDEDPI